MSPPREGERFKIASYKHDGKMHRTWEGSILLSNGSSYICGNDQIRVRESDGKAWITREPAICTFYPSEWFNVIAMLRLDGVYYYCNIGSPSIWKDHVLTYIDYDIDVKIYPDWSYEILDEEEFQHNSEKMNYPFTVITKVREATARVITLMQDRRGPFEQNFIEQWYERFNVISERSLPPQGT